LLTHQLADYQQLFVSVIFSREKACTARAYSIYVCKVPLGMPELLLDRFADFVDAWVLLHGNCKKLLPGLITIGKRLRTENFFNLRMHPVNQLFGDLTGLVREI